MRPLEIAYLKQGAVSVLTLQGGVVLGPPIDNLRRLLADHFAQGENQFVLNLRGVDRLDSSGVGVLVWVLQSSKRRGGTAKLAQLPKVIAQTLSMCRLLPLFEVYDTNEAAIASFG